MNETSPPYRREQASKVCVSEGWPRKDQELHARFDMKGRVELLKTGSPGAPAWSADAPSPFESGV